MFLFCLVVFCFSNSGLDLLLSRIAEGVRPSGQQPTTTAAAPAEKRLSSSTPIQRRGNKNKGDDDDCCDNINKQLPRLHPSCISEAEEGGDEGALQTTTTTAPGHSDLLVVGANNPRGGGCGKTQGSSRRATEGAVSDKGESAPTVEPSHIQREPGREPGRTTAVPPPVAAGGRAVRGVAIRPLRAVSAATDVNRGPVKMPGPGPFAAFGSQSKAVFRRRAAVGEALTGNGHKENRLRDALSRASCPGEA